MANDPLVTAPAVLPPAEFAAQAAAETPTDVTLTPPTAEQVRAADQVFAQTREQQEVAALLGVWTGAVLLHDLAADALHNAEPEEERRRRGLVPDPKPAPGEGEA